MPEVTKVALDAMGGDHAPGEMIKGAMDAISRRNDIHIFLVGQEELIKKEFNMSKNAFKRAVGRLLKEKKILINETNITVVK